MPRPCRGYTEVHHRYMPATALLQPLDRVLQLGSPVYLLIFPGRTAVEGVVEVLDPWQAGNGRGADLPP